MVSLRLSAIALALSLAIAVPADAQLTSACKKSGDESMAKIRACLDSLGARISALEALARARDLVPAPPASPAPALRPDTPQAGTFSLSANFDNGTTGAFGSGGNVVKDLTGRTTGKILTILYADAYSVNRGLFGLAQNANVTGTLTTEFSVYIPKPAAVNVMRKLAYHGSNPYAYRDIGYAVNRTSAGVGIKGQKWYLWAGFNAQPEWTDFTAPFQFDRWYRVKWVVNLGSVGKADCTMQLFIDDSLKVTTPPVNCRQRAEDGLGYFQVGDQCQTFDKSLCNEVRYLDDVSITGKGYRN
ncbi:MAG: hypothetical protein ABIS03_07870 [Gemmatimonadaceae bacterium]